MKRRITDAQLNPMRDHAATAIHIHGFLAQKHGTNYIHETDRLTLLKLAEDVMVLENEVRYPPTLWNRTRRKIGLLP